MRTIKTLSACVAILAISLVCKAESFVRPALQYAHFQDSHYSDKVGVGVDLGCALGDKAEHELSLGIDYVKWSYSLVPTPPAVLGAPMVSADGKLLPVMLNYRFRFGGEEASRIAYTIGPALGLTQVKGDMTRSFSGVYYSGSYSKWKPSYGASLGVEWKLQDNLNLEIGYRYLHINGVDASLWLLGNTGSSSITHSLGSCSTHMLQIGLRFSLK